MDNNGVFTSKFHYQEHDGQLTHILDQPTKNRILDRNAELRRTPGILRDLGTGAEGGTWGRLMATIPLIMFEEAIREGFDLNSPDADHAAKEMARFLLTPKGRACVVQGK